MSPAPTVTRARIGHRLFAGLLAPALASRRPARTPRPLRPASRRRPTTSRTPARRWSTPCSSRRTYDKAKKTPLVVALHGLGSNPQQIIRYRGLTDQAEKYGYIVVAPMGYNTARLVRRPRLANGQDDDPENLGELSEKDVMNVLDIVRKEYTIDPDRIYLMGHSMGGGGTWHLGIKYPDMWAGSGPDRPGHLPPGDRRGEDQAHPGHPGPGGRRTTCARSGRRRAWAEQMKKLGMTYRVHRGGRRGPRVGGVQEHAEDVRVLRPAQARPGRGGRAVTEADVKCPGGDDRAVAVAAGAGVVPQLPAGPPRVAGR